MNLETIRQKSNEFMLDTNCINTILTKKIEDFILLEELPVPIQIGEKILYVGTFTFNNEQKFFKQWALLTSALKAQVLNWEMSVERSKELSERANFDLIAHGDWMLEFLLIDKKLKKAICKMLHKTLLKQEGWTYDEKKKERVFKKWNDMSLRYLMKHINKEKIIQICWLIYLYNFDSVKKNLQIIVEKMGVQSLTETYIPFWLQNLAGLTGKFVTAQVEGGDLPSADWLNKDKEENDEEDDTDIPRE